VLVMSSIAFRRPHALFDAMPRCRGVELAELVKPCKLLLLLLELPEPTLSVLE